MNLNPVVLSIPLYFVLIGIELIIDRFQKRNLYRLNDAVTNISCGITQQLTGIFLKVIGVGVYMLVYENIRIFEIPSNWITLSILFVAADFCYYWAHRMSHEINLFWGGHVVHHQSEDYNLSVALRQSTFQTIWTFMFHLPLALIGFSTMDHIYVMGINLIYQFWIHTETIGKLGWFEYLFNTPSHHRVHHGRNPKYIDRNHAGVFIIWDRLFGTFKEEEERPTYGITTPINSWNPVWVNVNHYVFMLNTMISINGVWNKIKYLFKKPGWMPEEMGGYQSAPSINKQTYQKFKTSSSMKVNYYVLFQYALSLALTAFFLFNQANFDLATKVLLASGVIITIMNCGLLFENKNWVRYVEILRILLIVGLTLYFSFENNGNMTYWLSGVIYGLISIIWLLSLGKLRSDS